MGPIPVRMPVAHNVAAYLESMNLFDLGSGARPTVGPQQQHLPLIEIRATEDVIFVAQNLQQILLDQMGPLFTYGLEEHLKSAIGITVAELLENFQKHAESGGIPAIACAQYYPGTSYRDPGANPRRRLGLLEIAIADTGIGLEKSLRGLELNAAKLDRGANPCEYACEFRVTSKPEEHTGYGLWLTKRLVERNRGYLTLLSGPNWLKISNGRTSCGTLHASWPGTFIGMQLYLDRPLDMQAVYEEMGSVGEPL